MAINALIAQGIRPVGADLPEIANMLQQKKQQTFQNSLATSANTRAQGEFDRQASADEAAKKVLQATQSLKETEWALSAPSKVKAINALPHVVEKLRANGIDTSTLTEEQATSILQETRSHVSSILGQGPPQTDYKVVGNRVFAFPPNGGPPTVAVEAPDTPETFGAPFEAVKDGKPGMFERGNRGTIRPIEGVSPYEKKQTPAGDSTLINIVDKSYPNGYRTIRRADFTPGMQEWMKSNESGPKLSSTGVTQAMSKLGDISVSQRQLANLKAARAKLDKNTDLGYLVGGRQKVTAAAEGYDKALDALRTTIRKMTRTPGEGSMSDWEGRITQAQIPERTVWNETTLDQGISQLEELINGYQSVTSEMLGKGSNSATPVAPDTTAPTAAPSMPTAEQIQAEIARRKAAGGRNGPQ